MGHDVAIVSQYRQAAPHVSDCLDAFDVFQLFVKVQTRPPAICQVEKIVHAKKLSVEAAL